MKRNEKKIYFTLFGVGIFLWISFAFDFINIKKLFAFLIFVIIGGGFKYAISRLRIFVEFTPIVFFSVLIAHFIGWFWVIPYIFLTDMVPAFLGHHGPTAGSVPYWFWMVLFSIIMIPLDVTNLFFKIMIPFVYFFGCLCQCCCSLVI